MIVVYALVDPRDESDRYVGVTKNKKRRIYSHLREARLGKINTHKARWIRGLIAAGMKPLMRELEAVDFESWQAAETRWISKLRADGARLTNATDGGQGVNGHRWTTEQKARMAAIQKARVKDNPKSMARLAEASAAYWSDPESRRKQSERVSSFMSKPGAREPNRERAKARMSDPNIRQSLREKSLAYARLHPEKAIAHSNRMKLLIADPERSASLNDGHRTYRESAEGKSRMREASREMWKNTDIRERLAKQEVRDKIRASALRRWSDPEYRAAMSARSKAWANTPEVRAKLSARMKARWDAPGFREEIIPKFKAAIRPRRTTP